MFFYRYHTPILDDPREYCMVNLDEVSAKPQIKSEKLEQKEKLTQKGGFWKTPFYLVYNMTPSLFREKRHVDQYIESTKLPRDVFDYVLSKLDSKIFEHPELIESVASDALKRMELRLSNYSPLLRQTRDVRKGYKGFLKASDNLNLIDGECLNCHAHLDKLSQMFGDNSQEARKLISGLKSQLPDYSKSLRMSIQQHKEFKQIMFKSKMYCSILRFFMEHPEKLNEEEYQKIFIIAKIRTCELYDQNNKLLDAMPFINEQKMLYYQSQDVINYFEEELRDELLALVKNKPEEEEVTIMLKKIRSELREHNYYAMALDDGSKLQRRSVKHLCDDIEHIQKLHPEIKELQHKLKLQSTCSLK